MATIDIEFPKYQERSVQTFPTSDSWLIAGGPKDGKSVLCSGFSKKSLILDTQNGYAGISGTVWNISALASKTRAQPLSVLLMMLKKIEKERPDIDCIVVDVITDIDQWVQDEVCDDLGCKSIAAPEYGIGWGQHATRLRKILERIRGLAPTVIYVAHTIVDTDDLTNLQKTMWVPKRLKAWLPGFVDHNGWVYRYAPRGGKATHMLSFKGYEVADKNDVVIQVAGSRHRQLQGKSFELPESDPWKNVRDAYKTSEPKKKTGATKRANV